MRCLLVAVLALVALGACKKKSQPPPSELPDAAPPSIRARFDAAPADAAIDAPSERDRLVTRLTGYLELLSIDYWTFQLLAAFPGFPPGTTFHTVNYVWDAPPPLPPDALANALAAIRASTTDAPHLATDDAVRAYLDVHARWLPRILDLNAYYRASLFVDDEFDRARREAPDIATARRELAAVRPTMRTSILTAWRELSGDVPDSPRAIVGRAWESCLGFEDVVMTDPYDEKRVAHAISACRRSIPTVTALGKPLHHGFDDTLRSTAILIGNNMGRSSNFWSSNVTNGLAELTRSYVALWPTLPTSPAERPPP